MQPFNLTASNKPHLIDKINALDLSKQWQIIIRERKSKRTDEQNSRLWDLYTAVGEFIGEHKDKVHELMGYKFLRYQDTIGGEAVELIKSTTKLNTKEMATYQDNIEQWAANLGFYWELK